MSDPYLYEDVPVLKNELGIKKDVYKRQGRGRPSMRKHSFVAKAGLILPLLVLCVCAFGFLLAPNDPDLVDLTKKFQMCIRDSGEIGRIAEMSRSAVQRHRTKVLNELQKDLQSKGVRN